MNFTPINQTYTLEELLEQFKQINQKNDNKSDFQNQPEILPIEDILKNTTPTANMSIGEPYKMEPKKDFSDLENLLNLYKKYNEPQQTKPQINKEPPSITLPKVNSNFEENKNLNFIFDKLNEELDLAKENREIMPLLKTLDNIQDASRRIGEGIAGLGSNTQITQQQPAAKISDIVQQYTPRDILGITSEMSDIEKEKNLNKFRNEQNLLNKLNILQDNELQKMKLENMLLQNKIKEDLDREKLLLEREKMDTSKNQKAHAEVQKFFKDNKGLEEISKAFENINAALGSNLENLKFDTQKNKIYDEQGKSLNPAGFVDPILGKQWAITPSAAELKASMEAVKNYYMKYLSGAAVTESERNRIEASLGQMASSNEALRFKALQNLYNSYRDSLKDRVNTLSEPAKELIKETTLGNILFRKGKDFEKMSADEILQKYKNEGKQ